MKTRKEALLKDLEGVTLELIDIQYQLDPGKRRPVPTVPIIYPQEIQRDPFEVTIFVTTLNRVCFIPKCI